MSASTESEIDARHASTFATLSKVFGDGVFSTSQSLGNLRLFVPKERAFEVLKTLKDQCGFALLVELGGVDYLGYPGHTRSRFEVHYVVKNLETSEQLVIKVGVDDPNPTVSSVYSLWRGADWMEREVFDMYGITFDGHPDHRRILMPDEFLAYPLRKDYPLRGRGERHNFSRITRENS